jgi:hypothetical protein
VDDFSVPQCDYRAMMPDLENCFMGFAICGQNVRKVKKKFYGPGDLESRETQTDEIWPCLFVFQAKAPSQTLILDKERDRRMRALFKKLKK